MEYKDLIPPTQLIVGTPAKTTIHIHKYLKELYCTLNGCNICQICINIEQHKHPQQLWIEPEKTYTKDQLIPIMHSLSFMVDQHTHFFCIITQADLLTPLCANSLLKSLEEPPRNYHFILTTERNEQLLPTIRSRSVIYTITSSTDQPKSPELFTLFTQDTLPITLSACISSIKKFDQSKINEHETRILLEDLIIYYHKNTITNDKTTSIKQHSSSYRTHLLYELLDTPIMPGSSKTILKQLFLEFFLPN